MRLEPSGSDIVKKQKTPKAGGRSPSAARPAGGAAARAHVHPSVGFFVIRAFFSGGRLSHVCSFAVRGS